jgi:hypothetical protein
LAGVQKMNAENVPGLRRFFEQSPRERAEKHAFTGQCDFKRSTDRQRE